MGFHEIGDKLESVCRQVLLDRWKNSRIIETKKNPIHGIDFAVEIIGQGVMIVEVKSATGSVRNGQMDIEWIKGNLTSPFKRFLQEAYQKKYFIGCATYRVIQVYGNQDYHFEDNQGQRYIVKSAPPTRKIDWQELLDVIFEVENDEVENDYDKLEKELSKIEGKYFKNIIEQFVGKEIDFREVREQLKVVQGKVHQTILTRELKNKLIIRIQKAFDDVSKLQQQEWERNQRERENNYEIKKNICLSIEKVSITDWKIASNRIKELQEQWKATGSVPKDKVDSLNERYRAACDKFFQQRQNYFDKLREEKEQKQKEYEAQQRERERNYERKIDICLSIESISIVDWKIATLRIKELQQKWKTIGSVPKDKVDELNVRYHSACDKFFQQRQNYFENLKKEKEQKQRERERKQKEWEERQQERARKQQEWEARQRERERKQKEWEERQRERARKQQEWEARQRERERKQKEWEERQKERERKQREWEERQRNRKR